MAGQQQTLKISVHTLSKGYLKKEGESGHYLKTCQWYLLLSSAEWQHWNLQEGLAAQQRVLQVIAKHSSEKGCILVTQSSYLWTLKTLYWKVIQKSDTEFEEILEMS